MKRSTIILLLYCLPVLAFTQRMSHPRPAPPGAWVLIGTTHAQHTADHDGIGVQGADNSTALKLKVKDAPLTLMKMLVTYDNGGREDIPIRFNIQRGGESRVIDLRGGVRGIRRVDFWYDTKGLLHRTADVRIFGRK